MPRTSFVALVPIVMLAAVVAAQGPPGFGPPGFGPPGFGPPEPGRPGFGPPDGNSVIMRLLGMREVRDELKCSDAQQRELDDTQQAMREAAHEALDRPGPPDFDATPDEHEAHFAAVRKHLDAVGAKAEARVREILNAQQRQRLSELQLQREGARAMVRDEIASQLILTEAQRARLNELTDAGFAGFGPPRPAPNRLKQALEVLSDEQRATWTRLAGAEFRFPEPQFGPGGPGGPGGPFGGPERKLVAQFDTDQNGWLDVEERAAARKAAAGNEQRRPGGQRGWGPGGPGGPGGREAGKPGPKVAPADVRPSDAPLYDPGVLRTFFLDFENADWEAELEAFHSSDVEVPATLTVDGRKYPQVGVHFRGQSSYGMIPRGSKRSLNVSLDFLDSRQRLCGYKTLNLLNANGDPSLMSTHLYSHIAREQIPAPKANFVRVVINGESWGVYVNVQQFDKAFLAENYQTGKGTRWKVPGSPGGRGGLEYLGADVEQYRRLYEIKSKDKPEAWAALIKLCQTLNETPVEQLEEALRPMLDIDGVLWFLAFDNALVNSDGYWTRASDYNIYLDPGGKFHLIPHDMNEAFHGAGGPGGFPPHRRMGGGPEQGRGPRGFGGPGGGGPGPVGGGGVALDPLVGLNDSTKPLRARLLAVPTLREQYLRNVRHIAEHSLDAKNFGPVIERARALIETEVAADTRKLSSYAAFQQAVAVDGTSPRNLYSFAKARSQFLLKNTNPKQQTALDPRDPPKIKNPRLSRGSSELEN